MEAKTSDLPETPDEPSLMGGRIVRDFAAPTGLQVSDFDPIPLVWMLNETESYTSRGRN